jgi:dienelactone hydrolase
VATTVRVSTSDGDFDAHVVVPEAGAGPGIVVLQEIFGVGDYIKESAERLAGLGYVALAPDLYWRIEPGIALAHDEDGLGRAFETMQKLDLELAVRDSIDALKALRELPEVVQAGGGAGVLGFCLGGTLAFGVAIDGDPDVAVCYYGSGIPGMLGRGARSAARCCSTSVAPIPTSRASRSTRCATSPARIRAWNARFKRAPATPSTTTKRRCSTSPSRPHAPGS